MEKRKVLPYIILFLTISTAVFSQEEYIFRITPKKNLKIIEKYNLSKSINNKHIGHIYREIRGVLQSDSKNLYEGKYYDIDVIKHEGIFIGRKIYKTVSVKFQLFPDGTINLIKGGGYPVLVNFPVFSTKPVKKGDTWIASGERIIDPEKNGRLTRIKILVEYCYRGIDGNGNFIVTAKYHTTYGLSVGSPRDPYGDEDLQEIQGSHNSTISISGDGSGKILISDIFFEKYKYSDKKEISVRGTDLIIYDSFISMDRKKVVKKVETSILKRKIKDVEVVEHDDGISLIIKDLHFIADRAVLLKDEAGRINSIASLLADVPDRTFLVVGHTADVGTKESQIKLSIRRAKMIVEELVKRGIKRERFIYEGRGGSEPIALNDIEENMRKNRRVEIIILED